MNNILQINGSLSVNERFADNAAFRLIFDFFDQQKNNFDMLPFIGDSFSIDQLFAIVVAQGFWLSININGILPLC